MVLARLDRWFVSLMVVVVALLSATPAHAYPWMIRYRSSGCASCHTDPSGAGTLTTSGRASSELLTRSDEVPDPAALGATDPGSPASRFLWGAFPLPDNIRLGGDLRGAYASTTTGDRSTDRRLLLPRADFNADLELARFRVAASVGYAATGSTQAALTRRSTRNLVSRDHWLGYEIGTDRSWLLRAGRIGVPFGLRVSEGALWVRSATRTTLDDDQEYGAALYGTVGPFRGEIMAIVGNFQIRPDDYRERGYSAYVEGAATPRLAIGVSSLVTRATRDIVFRVTDFRHAHGAFARWSPAPPLALLAEADWLYQSLANHGHRSGHAAFAQADWEAKQGIHVMLTFETKNDGGPEEHESYGAWASAVWFFAPHADLRLDDMYRRLDRVDGGVDSFAWLATLHLYL